MENQENQNHKKNLSITIKLPNIEKLILRRPLIPILFLLSIALFSLSFCEFSCSGKKIGTVSGFNLLTGTDLTSRNFITGKESKGEHIPANMWAIISLSSLILGSLGYFFRERKKIIYETIFSVVGILSLIVLNFSLTNSIEKESHGQVEISFLFGYWITNLVILTIFLFCLFQLLKSKGNKELNKVFTDKKVIIKDDTMSESPVLPNSQDKIIKDNPVINFVKRNSKKIVILLLVLFISIGGYLLYVNFFSPEVQLNKKIMELRTTYKEFNSDINSLEGVYYSNSDENCSNTESVYEIKREDKGCGMLLYGYYKQGKWEANCEGYIFVENNCLYIGESQNICDKSKNIQHGEGQSYGVIYGCNPMYYNPANTELITLCGIYHKK